MTPRLSDDELEAFVMHAELENNRPLLQLARELQAARVTLGYLRAMLALKAGTLEAIAREYRDVIVDAFRE